MITLKQINCVLNVAEALHFKNAVDPFLTSPSMLSITIANLENQLRIKIFNAAIRPSLSLNFAERC
jgi:DNA-binding transcriptional LysR family regulator